MIARAVTSLLASWHLSSDRRGSLQQRETAHGGRYILKLCRSFTLFPAFFLVLYLIMVFLVELASLKGSMEKIQGNNNIQERKLYHNTLNIVKNALITKIDNSRYSVFDSKHQPLALDICHSQN